MDFSSEPKGSLAKDSARFLKVPLPPLPLSPWLRLAHITTYPKGRVPLRTPYRTLFDFELVFQLSGGSWIAYEALGGSLDVRAGEVALIPPGHSHAWAGLPGRHIAVHFDLQAQPSILSLDAIQYSKRQAIRRPLQKVPHIHLEPRRKSVRERSVEKMMIFPAVTRLSQPRLWRERLEPLIQLWNRRTQGTLQGQLIAAEAITWALNTILEDARDQGVGLSQEIDPAVATLLKQLDRGTTAPSVAQMAKAAGMGLTSFRQSFQQATGRAPRQYVEELRLERASRALAETDFSIQRIGHEEGYEDPYHFSRAFKRVMGESPRAYRKRIRER